MPITREQLAAKYVKDLFSKESYQRQHEIYQNRLHKLYSGTFDEWDAVQIQQHGGLADTTVAHGAAQGFKQGAKSQMGNAAKPLLNAIFGALTGKR